MIAGILGLHALVAVVVPGTARRAGRRIYVLAAVPFAALLAWVVSNAGGLLAGEVLEERIAWVPSLDLEVALRVDAFSGVMLLLISGLGLLIVTYSSSYVGEDPAAGRFCSALVGFGGAMAGIVAADHLLLLYVFWELTSITSYVLIGGAGTDEDARSSAQHALIVTVVGGLAMLAGFVVIGQAADTYLISELTLPARGGITVAAMFVLLGAFTKSAQVPFHGWLPAAMVAPTPVSAYLHSATMVTAGVYLVARLAPVLSEVSSLWVPVTATVGLSTMVLAAAWALRTTDLKRLLAYGTISQLGFMMALVGAGEPDLLHAGIAVLVAHALYKSALFLTVGNVDHAAGTRDLRRLRGVGSNMPVTASAGLVAAVSMMGLPPMFGYVTKEAGLDSLLHLQGGGWTAATTAVVVGSLLTVAYGLRFVVGGLTSRTIPGAETAGDPAEPDHELGATWTGPIILLALLTITTGLAPGIGDEPVRAAVEGLSGMLPGHLELWHGPTLAVVLSGVAIVLGVVVHAGSGAVARTWERLPRFPDAGAVFRRIAAALIRVATEVTGVVQSGSLPVYLAIIAITVLVVPATGLLTGPVLLEGVSATTTPVQIVVAGILVAAAMGIALTHRRFVALLFLGTVGYGMAVIFWLHGAPDLALTQATIETVTLTLFVLVLRRLPERFTPPRWAFGRASRLTISVLVGVLVAGLAILATSVNHPSSISLEYLTRALPEADGHNVVNVILVDFRAMDTVGEITVLVVAALGITEIIGRVLRKDEDTPRVAPLFGGEFMSPIVVATISIVYPVALLASVYFLVAGHNQPGGGFVGGLVAGAALLLRYVTRGSRAMGEVLPMSPVGMVAVGLLVSIGTGIGGALAGYGFLGAAVWSGEVPIVGSVKASSTLLFDVGVYLIVIGFVSNALRTFGAEEGPA